ncbi:MAG: hypothetical protein ACSHWY_07010 [Octadecabacter sp.]
MTELSKSPLPLAAKPTHTAPLNVRGRSLVLGATPAKLARFLDLLDAEFTKKSDGGGAEGV